MRTALPPPAPLALAILAAVQGGMLLSPVQWATRPLEAALDAMLALIGHLSAA